MKGIIGRWKQIKYLALNYPLMCSEIEQLYFQYFEETGRRDFVGFELKMLKGETK